MEASERQRTGYVVLREEGEGSDLSYRPVAEVGEVPTSRAAIEEAIKRDNPEAEEGQASSETVFVAIPLRSFRREQPFAEMVMKTEWRELGRGIGSIFANEPVNNGEATISEAPQPATDPATITGQADGGA